MTDDFKQEINMNFYGNEWKLNEGQFNILNITYSSNSIIYIIYIFYNATLCLSKKKK